MSKRRAYTVEFKIEVIKYAENHSNRETGRKYNINEKLVRGWLKMKDKLNYTYQQSGHAKKRLKLGSGRKPRLPTLEISLIKKITEEREQGHHVSCKMVKAWAKELANENGWTEFAASPGWLCKFLNRCNLRIGKRPKTSDRPWTPNSRRSVRVLANSSTKNRQTCQKKTPADTEILQPRNGRLRDFKGNRVETIAKAREDSPVLSEARGDLAMKMSDETGVGKSMVGLEPTGELDQINESIHFDAKPEGIQNPSIITPTDESRSFLGDTAVDSKVLRPFPGCRAGQKINRLAESLAKKASRAKLQSDNDHSDKVKVEERTRKSELIRKSR